MEKLNLGMKFLQDNAIMLLLILGFLLLTLKALAALRKDLAALTPSKRDDREAELFEKKSNAVIRFFKSIFKLKDDDEQKPSN